MTSKAANLTSLQVRAFQELWKANHPQTTITPTGQFDGDTEKALLQAPADGFSLGAQCGGATPRISCCTGDKKKGTCMEPSNCPDANERNGPCNEVSNSVCCKSTFNYKICKSSLSNIFSIVIGLGVPPVGKCSYHT